MSKPKPMSQPTATRRAAITVRGAAKSSGVQVKKNASTARQGANIDEGAKIYGIYPHVRIAMIRQGIPASTIGNLSSRMGMSKESLLSSLGLSRATISSMEKDATALSKGESERVRGVPALIGMVQSMVEQSGDPAGFNAARWVSEWLFKPLRALGGETPASYMDTFEGQKLVSELLSMSQSGAYA
jgi:uncharacterized protein (DUF2384 family)